MNVTLYKYITNDCFEWCREQHFIHQSNLETQLLFICLIVAILLFINYAIIKHNQFILKYANIYEETLQKTVVLINEYALYLLIVFLIYILLIK